MREKRENPRERSVESWDQARRADLRGNLHSIFVDNLNQQADLPCLWGVFKCFGRVRDIYLPAANRSRRSGYAFVRFATLEEAQRVTEMTNGMHIYGWPIKVSVAQYGWKNRRLKSPREAGGNSTEEGTSRGQQRERE
ncbi:hypothetical protein Dsin_015097 [Dipteronia sinensis]|uniref:RRM domain-containing protein n=1 Tax=Dipteronia sinensis TaxID=43782 RepID=A0AAE0APD1_9ROSI|nr:hypothetical protein Dsin_015097 [Dipteronia sinensis]